MAEVKASRKARLRSGQGWAPLAVRAALLALLLVVAAAPGRADTLVVAGEKVKSPVPFVVGAEEVYAPLLPVVKHLDAKFEVLPDAIQITAANRRQVVISRNRPEATLDGALRPLPGIPRRQGREFLLPARAVGSLLGCAVRWDSSARTLFIHPWVRKFSLDTLPDRYRLTIGSEAPITYRAGKLENPPRLFVDILNADLASITTELTAEKSYFRGAKIGQNSLAPAPEGDVARVVVELDKWRPYRIRASGDRCLLYVDFPLAEAEELPLDGPPVVLSKIGFERRSPSLAAVTLSLFGVPRYASGSDQNPPTVWVDVANAEDRLQERRVTVRDNVVSEITCGRSPDNVSAQRLKIVLKEETPYAVVAERGEMRVLLGRVELSDVCVAIDAGHGGHDTGAVGRSGLREKDVNLDIARRVAERLRALGAEVILTRTDDRPVTPWARGDRAGHRRELLARCTAANDGGADLFVSIHSNARESNPHQVQGTETYYRKNDSIGFARVMQQEVVRSVGLVDGGVKYHPRPIIVLYQTNMPAVLVEVGYLSHPEDEARLATDELRERAAAGIVNGLLRYVEGGGVLSRWRQRPAGDSEKPERVEGD